MSRTVAWGESGDASGVSRVTSFFKTSPAAPARLYTGPDPASVRQALPGNDTVNGYNPG